MAKDLANTTNSDYTNQVKDFIVEPMQVDGVADQEETTWMNNDWTHYWGYFNQVPDLKSALLMKAIWNVGKGYNSDNATRVLLDNITGWGKDSFEDIIFNMEVIRRVNGDAYAEIVKSKEGKIINLKPLNPGNIRIVVSGKGIIKRYEQVSGGGTEKGNVLKLLKRMFRGKSKDKVIHSFKPEEIFHLTNNRLADQIHGISDIKALEDTILADEESFDDIRKLAHRQARPFIIWKLKTDDQTKIDEVVSKINRARNLGEDTFIPDDDDAVSFEIVQINPSQIIMEWRNDIRNRFYRAIGLPQIIPGAGGQGTESESKVIMTAFGQIVEHSQKIGLERQIWNQLAIKIDFIPPITPETALKQDEAKDANQQLAFQPSEGGGQ